MVGNFYPNLLLKGIDKVSSSIKCAYIDKEIRRKNIVESYSFDFFKEEVACTYQQKEQCAEE